MNTRDSEHPTAKRRADERASWRDRIRTLASLPDSPRARPDKGKVLRTVTRPLPA